MNYIGSKYRLAQFIKSVITETVGDIENTIFCDIFAGTGAIGRIFKTSVKKVISNDIEYYAFVLNKNYIENNLPLECNKLLCQLNQLTEIEGFIYKNYAHNGSERNYFNAHNGKKIDAIRTHIAEIKKSNQINDSEYFFLLASLLESADKVANTASVYGAFLKHLKKTAEKKLLLTPAHFDITYAQKDIYNEVYNENANDLIKKIEGDILYLDPPYNARQYGSNYHLLNTIALYDEFVPKGKTGLRPNYIKSLYCQKNEAKKELEDLIKNAAFKHIFLSYNNEGIIQNNEIREIFEKYGHYDIVEKSYQRFMADKSENRVFKDSKTLEYIHILEKKVHF